MVKIKVDSIAMHKFTQKDEWEEGPPPGNDEPLVGRFSHQNKEFEFKMNVYTVSHELVVGVRVK